MSLSRVAAGSAAVVLLAGSAVSAQGSPPFLWTRAASAPSSPSFGADDTFWVANGRDCLLMRGSDGQILQSFDPGGFASSPCYSANFSHDGRWVAVINGYGRYVQIRRASDWTLVTTFSMSTARVAFSPDDRSLVLCAEAPSNSPIVDTATWTVRAQAAGDCYSTVPWLSISPNSQMVAMNRRIFRLSDGTDITPPSGFTGNYSPSLLGDDWIAVSAPEGFRVQTLNEPPQLLAILSGPSPGSFPTLSRNGRYIAAMFDSSFIDLWDADEFSKIAFWSMSGLRFRGGLEFSPDSTYLVSTSGIVQTWNVPDGTLRATLVTDTSITSELVFSTDGGLAAAGFGADGAIRLRSTEDGTLVQTVSTGGAVGSLAFSSDGQSMVSCCGNGVQSWKTSDGSLIQWLREKATRVIGSSTDLIAETRPSDTVIRRIPDLSEVRRFPLTGLTAFSQDGAQIVIGETLFDVQNGNQLQTFGVNFPRVAQFALDGQSVLFAGRNGVAIERFDVSSPEEPIAVFGKLRSCYSGRPPAIVTSLASGIGGSIAQASSVYRSFALDFVLVRIWDANGNLIKSYDSEVGVGWDPRITSSPDGRYFGWVRSDGVFGVSENPCADPSMCTTPLPSVKLYDNFADMLPINPALWEVETSFGTARTGDLGMSCLGGVGIQVDPNRGDARAILSSKFNYSLTGSDVHVDVPFVVGPGSVKNILAVQIDWDNALSWEYQNGTLYAMTYVGGIETILAAVPYSPSDHYHWRIRESVGTVYWETRSQYGQDWNIEASTSAGDLFPLDSVKIVLGVSAWAEGSPQRVGASYSLLNQPATLY